MLLDLAHLVDVKLKLTHEAVDPNEAEKVFVAAFEWMLVPLNDSQDSKTLRPQDSKTPTLDDSNPHTLSLYPKSLITY